MKYWWAIVLLLPYPLFAQERPAVPAAAPLIAASLPPNVNPEASPEFAWPDSIRAFTPSLFPLPTTTLKGRLVDSAGNPVKNELLTLEYLLGELKRYSDRSDGVAVPAIQFADATTDDNGEFAFVVPSLLDDPFFRDSGTPGEFWLGNVKGARVPNSTLDPQIFRAQKAYEPLTVRKTLNGTLSGKLGKEFLRQNNLPEDLKIYFRPPEILVSGIRLSAITRGAAGDISRFGTVLNVDGSFEAQLPAGKYDIELRAGSEPIMIERAVVIEENGRRIFERP